MDAVMKALPRIIFCALFAALLGAHVNAQQAPAAPAAATPPPAAATPAATPTPAPAANKLEGVVGNQNKTLTDRIPPEQILTLEAGADKFLARYIADLSGLPRGAVIILHDSGQHPSWPFTAAALIDDLPLHGWNTLAIELPTPAIEPTAAATTAAATATTPAAPSPAPATTTPPPAATPATASGIEPQVQARIAAAVKYFSDQKQTNVIVIGFGSGAIRAAQFTAQLAAQTPPVNNVKITAPITAMVLIESSNTLNGIDKDLPKILPETELPTLDITLDSEPKTRADADARHRAVLHQRQRIYRRMELPPVNTADDAQHALMVKRVRNWLEKGMVKKSEDGN